MSSAPFAGFLAGVGGFAGILDIGEDGAGDLEVAGGGGVVGVALERGLEGGDGRAVAAAADMGHAGGEGGLGGVETFEHRGRVLVLAVAVEGVAAPHRVGEMLGGVAEAPVVIGEAALLVGGEEPVDRGGVQVAGWER